MRTGRSVFKKQSKHRLTKPCIVRVRRHPYILDELKERAEDSDDEEDSPHHVVTSIIKASIPIERGKNFSKDDSPRSVKQESNTPKPASAKLDDSIQIKILGRKPEEPKNSEKPNLKKVEEILGAKSDISIKKHSEIVQTPKPKSKKLSELATPKPGEIKQVEEPIAAMASTRTRRAPKPNPKYMSDDIITPNLNILHKKTKDIIVLNEAGLGDTDSGDDFFYGNSNGSSDKEQNDDLSDAFELNDSSDFSEGDYLLKRKRIQKSRSSSPSRSITPLFKKARQAPTPTLLTSANSLKTKSTTPMPPRPKSVQQKLAQQQLAANRKRKFDEIDSARKQPSESIIARNKRLNIALYDSNVARPTSPVRNAAVKQSTIAAAQSTKAGATAQRPLASGVLTPKRPGPLSSKLGLNSQSNSPQMDKSKTKNDSPITQSKKSSMSAGNSGDPFDSVNTQDDFEAMPTFTIVNINDIINKKGDTLIRQRSDEDQAKTPNATVNRLNRRKTGHSTILSEKLDPSKALKPGQKLPFPPPAKKPVLQNQMNAMSRVHPASQQQKSPQQRVSLSQPDRKEAIKQHLPVEKPARTWKPIQKVSPAQDKPAPRILNSVVAKKTQPIQPILSKPDNDLDPEPIETSPRADEEKSVALKENLGGASNKVVPTAAKPTAQVRKLPGERVFIQRQGNKVIKKITCFETWYVINIPESQEVIVKNVLDIPLITLSNAVKTIKLPSSSWSSKVSLYKLANQLVNKSNLIPYTGDISDQSIKEEDREKYQPSCVMFRRSTQQKSQTRMPYDRAVIFKMKTFYTNIDGKNVRLVGAPSKITSFEDIEVLLELVDELDLKHEFVETASTV